MERMATQSPLLTGRRSMPSRICRGLPMLDWSPTDVSRSRISGRHSPSRRVATCVATPVQRPYHIKGVAVEAFEFEKLVGGPGF